MRNLWRRFRRTGEIERLEKALSAVSDPNIMEMQIRDGTINIGLEHPSMGKLFLAHFAELFISLGAENCLEIRARGKEPKSGELVEFTMMIQKVGKKTPMALFHEEKKAHEVTKAELENNYIRKAAEAPK